MNSVSRHTQEMKQPQLTTRTTYTTYTTRTTRTTLSLQLHLHSLHFLTQASGLVDQHIGRLRNFHRLPRDSAVTMIKQGSESAVTAVTARTPDEHPLAARAVER